MCTARLLRGWSALPLVVLALGVLVPVASGRDGPPDRSHDFEDDALGDLPDGWFAPTAGTTATVTGEGPAEGRQCLELAKEGSGRFGNLMQSFDAAPYRGRRVRFSAMAKTAGGLSHSRAQLWMRVDREGGRMGFFDNMSDRPIRSAEWDEYEITGDVDLDATSINIGLMVLGSGTAWLDAVSFDVVGVAGAATEAARPLTERGLANLVAFTRLLGYVRHFHPSDEAAETDWASFAVRGVHVVEGATDAEDLAARLESLFAPIAPGVTITAGPVRPDDDVAPATPAGAMGYTFWNHFGFGQHTMDRPQAQSIYKSWRERKQIAAMADEERPGPGETIERDLGGGGGGGGVRCRVPISVYFDDDGTLPREAPRNPEPADDWIPPDDWYPTGDDRGTRLAAIVIAWNIFQHFYPYFDVVETDWSAVLPASLRRAAEDPDADAFADTLRRLVAQLHDGHGHVSGRGGAGGAYRLPFTLDWVEDELVVTGVENVDGVGPNRGDVVVSLDGRTAEELWSELDGTISGATEQWKRYRAANEITARGSSDPFFAELRKPDGTRYSVRTSPVPAGAGLAEPRPEKIAEIEPGIWYVDIGRIDDQDFQSALSDLKTARGIVFDLRGYPGGLSTAVIAHLIDEPVTCAQWHVPIVVWPDRERMTFRFSNWEVAPLAPRLQAEVAFIIDGRAISYAETYMGIIEHYELAEIVGGPTAGTNGNVNPITLPGGYSISWTGMKVLKQDGSQHHGVGILPTVPAKRTIAGVAEGRDELLEKAVEVVKGDS